MKVIKSVKAVNLMAEVQEEMNDEGEPVKRQKNSSLELKYKNL